MTMNPPGVSFAMQLLLIAMLAVPAVGALVVALLPARSDRGARIVATGFAAVTLIMSLALVLVPSSRDFGWFEYTATDAIRWRR